MTTDWSRLVDQILPKAGGEDVVRMRTGVVDAENSDGTVDVAISGLVVPDLYKIDGMVTEVGDVVQVISYRGALIVLGAVASSVTSRSYGIPVMPTTTASNGTDTSGTTEVRDAVLGNYVFTAAAGRKYRAWWTGATSANVANDRVSVRIRDGGSSTPTTASTLIGETRHTITVSGGGGQTWIPPIAAVLTLTTGTHTFSAFTQRVTGSGVITPTFTRQLYVEDVGPA